MDIVEYESLENAAANGEDTAQYQLALLHLHGFLLDGRKVKKDRLKARSYLELASRNGNEEATQSLKQHFSPSPLEVILDALITVMDRIGDVVETTAAIGTTIISIIVGLAILAGILWLIYLGVISLHINIVILIAAGIVALTLIAVIGNR